jgi:hemerythrin HHE cation binding domain-containing protein
MLGAKGESMGEPDILQRMRRDHEQVLADVDVLERAAAGVGHERERNLRVVVTGLERQFHTHMAAEDELLFPALLESLPETAAQVSCCTRSTSRRARRATSSSACSRGISPICCAFTSVARRRSCSAWSSRCSARACARRWR